MTIHGRRGFCGETCEVCGEVTSDVSERTECRCAANEEGRHPRTSLLARAVKNAQRGR